MDWEKFNKVGLFVPMAHDSPADKPSVMLLFAYTAHVLALASLIAFNILGDHLQAVSATCLYAVICTVLYMLRKLSKAKFDLDDKSVELDSGDETNVKTSEN